MALVVALLYLALKQWREVFVVLATLPNAFAGALLALWISGETWNISSIVGMIGLFGVAVQNSLVLITQAKDLLAKGMTFQEALREASLGRVRPKLMTAGAAILGLLPMLFGFGGSELERPLAVAMVGGLITSTLFTLLALPSFYAWVETFTNHKANQEFGRSSCLRYRDKQDIPTDHELSWINPNRLQINAPSPTSSPQKRMMRRAPLQVQVRIGFALKI